jgi:serine protease AprX
VDPQPGTVLANHSYQYTASITTPTPGAISYRIRQIIDTAAASFSAFYIDTITPAIICVPVNTGEFFKVAPSLVNGNSTLIVQTNDAITNMPITIHDMKGRLVMRLNKSKTNGRANIVLPIAGLAGGKYIVTIYNNQTAIGTTEFVKLQ